MEALIRIQKELTVPKDQQGQGVPYKYRSAERIYETVKPLLQTAILTCTDTVVEVGSRIYVRATATLKEGPVSESCDGWAREQDQKKGLEAAQITGGCSSYARKYALCGLFLIDNGLDPDSSTPENAPSEEPANWTPTTGPDQQPPAQQPAPAEQPAPTEQPQPAAAPQGQIPAPNPEQREWLKNLWGFYVAGSQGKLQSVDAKPMQEMMKLCQLHMQRYPGSMSDIELCKRYIKVEELIG